MKNVDKEIKDGVIFVLILASLFYLVFYFLFYDLHRNYRLTTNNLKLQVRQMQRDAVLPLEMMLKEEEVKASQNSLELKKEWLMRLKKASNLGIAEFLGICRDYRNCYAKLKAGHDFKIRNAKEQLSKKKRQVGQEGKALLKKTREDLHPFNLVIGAAMRQKRIAGYMYDPSNGELMPRFQSQNKSHE